MSVRTPQKLLAEFLGIVQYYQQCYFIADQILLFLGALLWLVVVQVMEPLLSMNDAVVHLLHSLLLPLCLEHFHGEGKKVWLRTVGKLSPQESHELMVAMAGIGAMGA